MPFNPFEAINNISGLFLSYMFQLVANIQFIKIYCFFEDYHIIEERRFARPSDPKSYAGGKVTDARQVKG
jgi:hypothetical protein